MLNARMNTVKSTEMIVLIKNVLLSFWKLQKLSAESFGLFDKLFNEFDNQSLITKIQN